MKAKTRKAISAKRESKYVDFKESFLLDDAGAWCELIKDIVAMANSGGGSILLGVSNSGEPSGWNPSNFLQSDPADLTNRIAKYTGVDFGEFEYYEVQRGDATVALIEVGASLIPLVFERPGTYLKAGDSRQTTAFGRGTLYFRHGSKSEPAKSKDLRDFIDRELMRIRRFWLGNVRKVTTAPLGSQISVITPAAIAQGQSGELAAIRVVDDPEAPAFREVSKDMTHPYRQKDVIRLVNNRLADGKRVNSFDIQCVRKAYAVQSKPEFSYKPRFSSMQYSERFVSWLVSQYESDTEFFEKARRFEPTDSRTA